MFPFLGHLKRNQKSNRSGASSSRSIRSNRGLLEDVAKDFQPKALARAEAEGVRKKTSEPINVDTSVPSGIARHTIVQATSHMINELEDVRPSMVRISTAGEDLINKIAVVEITSKSKDPNERTGVNSKRMGIANNGEMCTYCSQFACPGHYGKITLNTMVIHPIYNRQVIAVLQSICHNCSGLILSRHTLEDTPSIAKATEWNRLKEIASKSVGKPCLRQQGGRNECYARRQQTNPPIDLTESKNKNYVVYVQDNHKRYYSAADIRMKLDGISDEDARLLGFGPNSHPRDLIITVLPVIPPIARPSVCAGSDIKPDQLTEQYSKIVVSNAAVLNSTAETHLKGDKLYDDISELIIKKRAGRVSAEEFFSILRRINGKDSITRRATQGKRVDFSARGVLSPGSDLEFGEVGVPESVARFFHMPVTITQANYNYVVSLIQAGRIVSWTPSRGPRKGIKLSVNPGDSINPKIGDEIERWAEDGDMVVFNRQPSLHKYSFLGYTIKIIQDNVMRVHPSSTGPHNADFDGDTANQLYPRDAKSVEEVRQLMHAVNNMINEMQNKPIVGLILDSIASAFLLTRPDEAVDTLIFADVLGKMKTQVNMIELQERAARYGLHPFSGRTLFSALFPKDFYYKKGDVWVIDGVLVAGQIKSMHVGATHRSVIQDIHKEYGAERAARFLTDATWMLIAWLDTYGFSVGPTDCEFGASAKSQEEKLKNIGVIRSRLEALGKIPREEIRKEHHEKKVQKELDAIKVLGKNIAMIEMVKKIDELGRSNSIGVMVKDIGAGGKGDLFNVCQIGAAVGQQFYNGARLCPSLSGGQRCLPTQPCRDPKSDVLAPMEERGFCISSFWEGMSVEEMFYLLWGGREGLINTSKSTAEVGATQRDLSKALENIVYMADGTVRSVQGPIYSFSYGNDGLESGHLLNVNTPSHGTIPSYCDTDAIIEQANAAVGWIRAEVLDKIAENENMHEIIERGLQRDIERREEPVSEDYDYGVPVRQSVASLIRDPEQTPSRYPPDIVEKLLNREAEPEVPASSKTAVPSADSSRSTSASAGSLRPGGARRTRGERRVKS